MTNSIDFECNMCGDHTQVEYGEEETDDNGNLICKTCTGQQKFENLDFPVWVEWESYNDTYGLLENFCYHTGLDHEDVPIAREMKYTVFCVWYKVTEDGVEGPYSEKGGELL